MNTNKTLIPSTVPLLPNKAMHEPDLAAFNISPCSQPGNFRLADFLSRYLSGKDSLRGSRSVARKRLALASSGILSMDTEAMDLHIQNQRYLHAKQLLQSKQTNNYAKRFTAN